MIQWIFIGIWMILGINFLLAFISPFYKTKGYWKSYLLNLWYIFLIAFVSCIVLYILGAGCYLIVKFL